MSTVISRTSHGMRITAFVLSIMVLAGSAQAAPLGDPERAQVDSAILADMDDASFDAAFACPEILPTANHREADFERFIAWAHLRHPDWNIRKRLDVRMGMLRRHGCEETLALLTTSRLRPFPLPRK